MLERLVALAVVVGALLLLGMATSPDAEEAEAPPRVDAPRDEEPPAPVRPPSSGDDEDEEDDAEDDREEKDGKSRRGPNSGPG